MTTPIKAAPDRLTDNVAAGKGVNLTAAEAASLQRALNESRQKIQALQQEQLNPTEVLCPKCDQWAEPWHDGVYACKECMPDRQAASMGTVRWKEPEPHHRTTRPAQLVFNFTTAEKRVFDFTAAEEPINTDPELEDFDSLDPDVPVNLTPRIGVGRRN